MPTIACVRAGYGECYRSPERSPIESKSTIESLAPTVEIPAYHPSEPFLHPRSLMTPTLMGRWQTRILLLTVVGFPITLPFTLGILGPGASPIFGLILLYVILLGFLWDTLYNTLQKFRWDRDWPGALQLIAGIWEAAFLAFVIKAIGVPGIAPEELNLFWFAFHYSCVWIGVYLVSQSLMRVVFPRWRFRGGRWL